MFKIRLPIGEIVNRRFSIGQEIKVFSFVYRQDIFAFVASLDEKYFEEPELELDIMTTYPTRSLKSQLGCKIESVFQDTNFEQLYVKEGE